MEVPPLHACWAGPQPQPAPPAPGSRISAPRPAPAPRPRPTVPPSGVTVARAPAARAASGRAVSGRISPVELSREEPRALSSPPGAGAAQPPRPSPSSAQCRDAAARPAVGAGQGPGATGWGSPPRALAALEPRLDLLLGARRLPGSLGWGLVLPGPPASCVPGGEQHRVPTWSLRRGVGWGGRGNPGLE